MLLLALIGFLVASPFLTRRGVGTGEAYNYSLAVADGVTQLRAGVFPVLVGQTPFAFNGRVHPLRNAPYLIYLAGAIDLASGHRLGFPALQNFSLAFSLLGSCFASYLALRWGVRCPPWPAVFLASVYGSSAALLAAAYSMDLYMTVHAAPFVPLALGAVARQAENPSPRNDFLLAAALAASWWAHPPVALWLTVSCGLLRAMLWIFHPSWRSLGGLAGALLFGFLLAGFTFLSAFEITHYAYFFNAGARESAGFVALVLSEVRRSFVGSVSPISRSAGTLGDFQLGYVAWLLLGSVLVVVRRNSGPWQGRRLAGAGLAGVALLMIGLCIPVPYFTGWAWSRLPGVFYLLTNDWPMQRLYLIALAAIMLASGLVLVPRAQRSWHRHPIVLAGLLTVGGGWMVSQSAPFVIRGFHDRWSEEVTLRNYLPSNVDLTTTSYAFLQAPASFSHGVMEPWTEFRLLADDGRDPVSSNYSAGLTTAKVVAEGTFRQAARAGTATARYEPAITLEPGRHYLLDFAWRSKPFAGILTLTGPSLQRIYILPHAGESESFGMSRGQRTALAISTSRSVAEPVQLQVLNPTGNPRDLPPLLLADFRLLAVEDARLPVRVQSWLPLRAAVTAPGPDFYVETPRCFIPGYLALVNGRRVLPVRSSTGQVMFPVPAGESQVELRYPGTPLLRIAFWTSVGAWLGGAGFAGLALLIPRRILPAPHRAMVPAPRNRRPVLTITGAFVVASVLATVATLAWRHFHPVGGAPGTVGPLDVRLLLPRGLTSRQQPIVVAGQKGAGDFIFLSYTDDRHVRVGVDLWGFFRLSDPVHVDYNQEQELVVSGGMLYPPGDPFMRALTPSMRNRLRTSLEVELNGHTVLVDNHPTYDSDPARITIGSTAIGGSMVEPRFRGKILEVRRLPVPLSVVRSRRPLPLQLTLPDNHAGLTEPLLTAVTGRGIAKVFTVTYLSGSRVAFGYATTDGIRLEGTPQPGRAGTLHSLVFSTRGQDLALIFDGRDGLRVPGGAVPPGELELARLGINPTGLADIRARFTGPKLAPRSPIYLEPSPGENPQGPFRVVVELPAGKWGAVEPLIVTGTTSRGDVVYIKYTDPGHIQFGYDHWGVGGGVSQPIAVNYALPHEFEIGLGSLYPERKDAAWLGLPADVRQRLRQQVTVHLDGAAIWECKGPAYPSRPGDIRVGENRIGASSCGKEFTGEILEIGRAGP